MKQLCHSQHSGIEFRSYENEDCKPQRANSHLLQAALVLTLTAGPTQSVYSQDLEYDLDQASLHQVVHSAQNQCKPKVSVDDYTDLVAGVQSGAERLLEAATTGCDTVRLMCLDADGGGNIAECKGCDIFLPRAQCDLLGIENGIQGSAEAIRRYLRRNEIANARVVQAICIAEHELRHSELPPGDNVLNPDRHEELAYEHSKQCLREFLDQLCTATETVTSSLPDRDCAIVKHFYCSESGAHKLNRCLGDGKSCETCKEECRAERSECLSDGGTFSDQQNKWRDDPSYWTPEKREQLDQTCNKYAELYCNGR